MAIHDPTPPNGGGERYRSPKPQIGPVSRAVAIMQAADPDRQRVHDLRRMIGDRIEADIALLDMLSADADLEEEHDAEGDDDDHDNGIADPEGLEEQVGGTSASWTVFA